jgi:hypothetical protein
MMVVWNRQEENNSMNQTTIKPFVELKDVSFSPYAVVAYGRSVVPQTMQTPEYPTLTIWLRDTKEPITAIYETEEERNNEYAIIKEAVNSL